jgi:hypothetical protein
LTRKDSGRDLGYGGLSLETGLVDCLIRIGHAWRLLTWLTRIVAVAADGASRGQARAQQQSAIVAEQENWSKPKIASSGGVVGNQGLVRGSLLRRKFASAESPGFRVRATRIPGLGDSGCGSCCEQLWSRDLVLDSPSEATARRHLCEGSCRPEHQLGWRTRNQSVGQQAGQWGPKVGVQAPGRGNIRD